MLPKSLILTPEKKKSKENGLKGHARKDGEKILIDRRWIPVKSMEALSAATRWRRISCRGLETPPAIGADKLTARASPPVSAALLSYGLAVLQ